MDEPGGQVPRFGTGPRPLLQERRRQPAASGPPPAETPCGRSPWGGRTAGVKRPGKAERRPPRTPDRTRPPGGGRQRRHRIPGRAAGPTSGSRSLPPSAPPPPGSTKPAGRRGPGLLGGRLDETGPGPGAPRLRLPSPGASRVPVTDGADAPPGWP
ncbi:proline-rich protein HaeIII subfamily 1-like [Delphinus delphis]|uniref:proline-rich protein HaeIII subfamily 1-like n=1 Tax=Delphinus delphis TaxID=9728 RepID=UPI003751B022